jgi:hypothetical protein
MNDYTSKPLEQLSIGDVLQVDDDHRIFRVARIEPVPASAPREMRLELRPVPDGTVRILVRPAESTASVLDLSDLEALRLRHATACADERRLWADAKGRHPGQPGHDAGNWGDWMSAANQVQSLARLLGFAENQARVRKGLNWG